MVGFGGKPAGALAGSALFLGGSEPEVVLGGMRGDFWSSSGSPGSISASHCTTWEVGLYLGMFVSETTAMLLSDCCSHGWFESLVLVPRVDSPGCILCLSVIKFVAGLIVLL